jgi:hypothetical protein
MGEDLSDLELELKQFCGTENYYRHWLGFNYTDGVKYLAEKAGAYWLLDVVGSYQPQLRNKEFQIWRLDVQNNKGIVTMREDDGLPNIIRQEIPYTDFPLHKFEMYFVDNVLLLKGEY